MSFTPEIIEKLKLVKEERGYSLQDIVDMTEAAGCAVSLTTIKRVFSNSAKPQAFRYSKTIKPIADVLLGPDDLHNEDINDVKSDVIDLLGRQIGAMEEQQKRREQEYAENLEHLKTRINRIDKIVRILAIILGVFLTAVIAVLLIDTFNPNVGWFRG